MVFTVNKIFKKFFICKDPYIEDLAYFIITAFSCYIVCCLSFNALVFCASEKSLPGNRFVGMPLFILWWDLRSQSYRCLFPVWPTAQSSKFVFVCLCLESVIAISISCLPLSLGFCVFVHEFSQFSVKWSVMSLFVITIKIHLQIWCLGSDWVQNQQEWPDSGGIDERECDDRWSWRVKEGRRRRWLYHGEKPGEAYKHRQSKSKSKSEDGIKTRILVKLLVICPAEMNY